MLVLRKRWIRIWAIAFPTVRRKPQRAPLMEAITATGRIPQPSTLSTGLRSDRAKDRAGTFATQMMPKGYTPG